MSSLTPASRNQEATEAAMHDGIISGALTFVPTMGAMYAAMQNKTFMARTNMQSRTALVIMPVLFAFAYTAEHTLTHKMHEIAKESEHNGQTVQWAEAELKKKQFANNNAELQRQFKSIDKDEQDRLDMYRKSVEESGVCIIPGDRLGLHHKMANYVSANPIKVLASLAVPSVAWIFYGNSGKPHLEFSVKLLHTRVFGQFATLSLLLGVMGFKEFMDQNGKFITEEEASARVAEMQKVRRDLLERLAIEKQHELEQQQEIAKAHEEDVRDHNVHTKRHHKKHHAHHDNKKQHQDNNVVAV